MFIGKKYSCYRPYYMVASGREYKVEQIHFYKDNKILVSSRSGWLEKQSGADIRDIELSIDEIKVKRKVNFDGKVFAISKGKESYGTDLTADLYIPADMLNIHFVENVIQYKTQVRAIYKGSNDIYISDYIKSIDGVLNSIRNQYEEIYKDCDEYNLGYHTENILEKLDSLRVLAEQYIAEKKIMESLTINDIEI